MKNAAQNLATHLEQVIPQHDCSEIYGYSLFPAGKLFRPRLAYAMAMDLGLSESDFTPAHPISLLASSIEMHHVYTLIHDDLPCMDDDDIRRGRPSAHKQFNEWMAVLAGDGLLNASFQLLSRIDNPNLAKLLRFYSWATGAKGLILGQMMDLNQEAGQSLARLLEIHRLKTSRLIQVSLCGPAILLSGKFEFIRSYRLGDALGVLFQLIDDLSELGEPLGEHEMAIHPWVKNSAQTLKAYELYFHKVEKNLSGLDHTSKVVSEYIQLMTKKMASTEEAINKITGSNFFKKSIHPLLARFN